MAAPKGNQYAVKDKRWQQAIDRALAKRCKGDGIKALDELAEKLLLKCDEGDMSALKELGDRIEGKPAQAIEASGPNGGPIQMQAVEMAIIDPHGNKS